MAKYLQCTSSNGTDISIWKTRADSPVLIATKTIHIAGGANIRDRKSIFTPTGAMTEVSDADYADLCREQLFQKMVDNGFIVVTDDHHLNVKDNAKADASAQKTPEYYERQRGGKENPVPSTDAPDTEG